MLAIQDFTIQDTSVICPQCNTVFATPDLSRMPNMTTDTEIEADLHRVLPDPKIRAALVAMCPCCIYTWWLSAFGPHYILPQLVPDAPEIDLSKKFAHAVYSGRQFGAHSLDLALMALNGVWCCREIHTAEKTLATPEYKEANQRWLLLAGQELDKALRDAEWEGNRSRYHYMMGEILRQMGQFQEAIKEFEIVDRRSMLPKQLVEHQKALAAARNAEPTRLPPFIVEEIFLPKPKILTDIPPASISPSISASVSAPISA